MSRAWGNGQTKIKKVNEKMIEKTLQMNAEKKIGPIKFFSGLFPDDLPKFGNLILEISGLFFFN